MVDRTRATLATTTLLVLAVACGSPSGPSGPSGPSTEPSARTPERTPERLSGGEAVRVFATGETRGHLKPCKCEQGQFGGLERRAAYLGGIARAHDLRIDLGNAAEGAGALAELRLESTLSALAAMGYQAFVPGELEAVIADGVLRESTRHDGLTVVTANLVRADGSAAFATHRLTDLPDGRTVAVVGLTQPVRPLPAGWKFVPARAALERAIAEIGDRADTVVVASSLDVADSRAAASGLPQVALTISSSDDTDASEEPSFALEDLDPARQHVVVVANFSMYVRCVDLSGGLRPFRTWRAWLGEDVPGASQTAEIVRQHRRRAADLHPTLLADIMQAQRDLGFVGSAGCAECHSNEHASWAASHHAHAMKTLVDAEAARDPDCVPCHLVDVPADGGSAELTNAAGDALGVGCEACHGPRREHVKTARLGVTPPGGAPTWSAREVCTGCHRPPEVRDFDFDTTWPHISHGAAAPR